MLLAAGFGMSAMSFIGGTIDTNLTEHLVAKGYDVWLFDYRAGIDLPSSRRRSRSTTSPPRTGPRRWPRCCG